MIVDLPEAVDLPEISADFLESLVAQATDAGGVVRVIDDIFQPLSAIYPITALRSGNATFPSPLNPCRRCGGNWWRTDK